MDMSWHELIVRNEKEYLDIPPESGEYLVALKDTDPFEYSDGTVEDMSTVIVVSFDSDTMIFNDHDGWVWNALRPEVPQATYIITHWMPLPDLPFKKHPNQRIHDGK